MNALHKALNITCNLGSGECARFRERIFGRNLPITLALAYRYKRTSNKHSYVEANIELREADEFLTMGENGNRLAAFSDDDTVRAFCDLKVDMLKRRFFQSIGQLDRISPQSQKAVKLCIIELKRYGLEFPCDNWQEVDVKTLSEALARVFDSEWWRRKIRKRQNELIETMNIRLGLVNLNKGIYVSNFMAQRKRDDRRRNLFAMKSIELENDFGQIFSLSELVKSSVSNPVNRRNELMTRIAGFDDIAKEQSDIGVFITLTAPSKYHKFLSKPCVPNPRYGGFTPKDTQAYLTRLWSRVRAAYKRKGIEPYGFRVVEPHHDGTPHWHMLFFIAPQHKEEMLSILKKYALQEDGDERGALEHRCVVVDIDPAKGSAAGYIAKYISKNIDGYNVEADQYGHDAVQSADRITAWASVHQIRQFEQIGGASVTVWRELRRLNGNVPESVKTAIGDDIERFTALVSAADQGNWKEFTILMGGVNVKRKEQFLRACYLIKEECGKYKETVSRLLGVLVSRLQTVVTRPYTWIKRRVVEPNRKKLVEQRDRSYKHLYPTDWPYLEFCQ